MDRMKTFAKYAILIIAFYFISNGLIFLANNGMYKNFSGEVLNSGVPKIEVKEAKTTTVNGYVKGIINNNTGSRMDGKYIKVSFYSAENIELGSESFEINNLGVDESRGFDIKFKYGKVNYYKINCVEEI